MLEHLDLFSGIGGFALAAKMVGSIETKQFVEIDDYCQKVLAKRFPGIPIHADINFFNPRSKPYDIITAGFPCQDISLANPSGRGLEGERSGLFFQILRIVRRNRPRYIVLENVPALLSKDRGKHMGAVLWHLSKCGYDAEWQVISAASVGAEHLRQRLFIIAYPHSDGVRRDGRGQSPELSRQKATIRPCLPSQVSGLVRSELWQVYTRARRTGDGVSRRVDRFKGVGNAIVPQAAVIALQRVARVANLTHTS